MPDSWESRDPQAAPEVSPTSSHLPSSADTDSTHPGEAPTRADRPASESESLEGALAEFAALRAEILHRMTIRWNIFALQLTASGVIFSFALADSSRIGFLLIVPVISYALGTRSRIDQRTSERIACYIRGELNQRAHGVLGWEKFYESFRGRLPALLDPNVLIFTGVSVTAIVWVTPSVWNHQSELIGGQWGPQIGYAMVWVVDVILALLSFRPIHRTVLAWLLGGHERNVT